MKLDYCAERSFSAQLNIDDDGNFCIEANNDKMLFWYFIVRTSMGKSQIVTYGPIVPDIELFPDSVTSTFNRIDYDKVAINKLANKFINDGRKLITQANLIDLDEALTKCRSIIDYMKSFDERLRY